MATSASSACADGTVSDVSASSLPPSSGDHHDQKQRQVLDFIVDKWKDTNEQRRKRVIRAQQYTRKRARRGILALQWAIAMLGSLFFVWLVTISNINTEYLCPDIYTPYNGTPLGPRSSEIAGYTTPYVYASLLILCPVFVLIAMSTALTAVFRYYDSDKRFPGGRASAGAADFGRRDFPDRTPSATSITSMAMAHAKGKMTSSLSNTSKWRNVQQLFRGQRQDEFGLKEKLLSGADESLEQGSAHSAPDPVSETALNMDDSRPDRSASTSSVGSSISISLFDDTNKASEGMAKRVLKVIVQKMLWLWHDTSDEDTPTWPQWFIFIINVVAVLYGLIFWGDLGKHRFGSSTVGFYITLIMVLLILFLSAVKTLQKKVLFRFKWEGESSFLQAIGRIVVAGVMVIAVQVFLWALFNSYAIASAYCLPDWRIVDKNQRWDVRELSSKVSMRFYACFLPSAHVLFLYLWWVVDIVLGRVSHSDALTFRLPISHAISLLLLFLATLDAIVLLGSGFSYHAENLFVKTVDVVELDFPEFLNVLIYAFFGLWVLVLLVVAFSNVMRSSWFQGGRTSVFVSYRQSTEKQIAFSLFNIIEGRSPQVLGRPSPMTVFLDTKSIGLGRNWKEVFLERVTDCIIFVPLVSWLEVQDGSPVDRVSAADGHEDEESKASKTTHKGSAGQMAYIEGRESADNVLLEWIVALELYNAGVIQEIFPVLSGGVDSRSGTYKEFPFRNIALLSDELHGATRDEAHRILRSKLPPNAASELDQRLHTWTPKRIVQQLLDIQGIKLNEYGAVTNAEEHAATLIMDVYKGILLDNPSVENKKRAKAKRE